MVAKLIRFKACQHIALLSQKVKSLEAEISWTELCCDFFFWRSNSFMDWQSGATCMFHTSRYEDSWTNTSISTKFLTWFYITKILKRVLYFLLAARQERFDAIKGDQERKRALPFWWRSCALGIAVSPGKGTWEKEQQIDRLFSETPQSQESWISIVVKNRVDPEPCQVASWEYVEQEGWKLVSAHTRRKDTPPRNLAVTSRSGTFCYRYEALAPEGQSTDDKDQAPAGMEELPKGNTICTLHCNLLC